MLTGSRLRLYVSNGNMRLVLIFVDPALREKLLSGCSFILEKMLVIVFTIKKKKYILDSLPASLLCYKLKQS